MSTVETFEHAGLRVEIHYDVDADNPLGEDFADVGRRVMWGDHSYRGYTPEGFEEIAEPELEIDVSDDWEREEWQTRTLEQALRDQYPDAALIFPLSWASNNHGPGTASLYVERFQDGQCEDANAAWIFTQAEIDAEWNGNAESVDNYVKVALREFVRWCNGEVYGVVVKSAAGKDLPYDVVGLDSCWGFIGYNYATEEGKRMAEDMAELLVKEETERAYWLARGVETV